MQRKKYQNSNDEKLYIHSIYLYLINMENIQEFEVKWKEAIEKNGSDTDFLFFIFVTFLTSYYIYYITN